MPSSPSWLSISISSPLDHMGCLWVIGTNGLIGPPCGWVILRKQNFLFLVRLWNLKYPRMIWTNFLMGPPCVWVLVRKRHWCVIFFLSLRIIWKDPDLLQLRHLKLLLPFAKTGRFSVLTSWGTKTLQDGLKTKEQKNYIHSMLITIKIKNENRWEEDKVIRSVLATSMMAAKWN